MALDNALVALIEQHRQMRIPRVVSSDALGDIDVDIAEEDAYLAGLLDQYTRARRVDAEVIELNSSIDDRLRQAANMIDDATIARLQKYRSMMLELANRLSAATGIPLKKVVR
jgi:hypothetical protein